MASDPLQPARFAVKPNTRIKLNFDTRILLLTLLISLPGAIVAELFLWLGNHSIELKWTVTLFIVLAWMIGSSTLHGQVIRPMQTLSNMVAAIREEDFSFRLRGSGREDSLADLTYEINSLAMRLQQQKVSALEATALLKKVMMEIDVAVFTFDQQQRLRIVNRAGEQLMGRIAARMLGLTAEELGLKEFLQSPGPQTVQMTFPGKYGRWAISHTEFRENGVPHQLLIISDLSRALREEERQAWQRLIRVLGHELNNSLAPIKSIAGSLATIVERDPPPADWRDDVQRGLGVIASRSEALSRFMSAYARLAKLPPPKLAPLDIGSFVDRVVTLEKAHHISVASGPRLTIQGDGDQLEQLLINLIRNAVDAVKETGGGVTVGWQRLPGSAPPTMELWVEDEGPGLSNTGNLFVPFFTTKPGGSGIGLVLSRQIAEAHGGSLLLENRDDRPGCRASLRIPLQPLAQLRADNLAQTATP
jgi:nitrogen fixation/metabolism regulation signal transduction histidine kinase